MAENKIRRVQHEQELKRLKQSNVRPIQRIRSPGQPMEKERGMETKTTIKDEQVLQAAIKEIRRSLENVAKMDVTPKKSVEDQHRPKDAPATVSRREFVEVRVRNGYVILDGNVQCNWEREVIGKSVRAVGSARGICNRINLGHERHTASAQRSTHD